ncbi:hypothetical protein [Clostridium felsineum]|uniref:hypothetical protein n=1 Tax=Clostridium felsineum TaxID=36839 RepID=UPI00098CBDBB|nr:hypothetical protein [Clostridium felsineum]URZ14655.1 hypothetical protein CLFE_006520 [Clostridium felsineum DSM 794]
MLPYFLKLEAKKHVLILGFFILLQFILSLLVLSNYSQYSGIYLQITSISWILITIYVFIDLYNSFYRGKDVLFHMVPIKTSKKFFIKVVVFSISFMLLWSTCLIFEFISPSGIYAMRIAKSSNPTMGVIYFILARFLSCISGIIILGLAILLGKLFKNKFVSAAIIFLTLFLITFGLYQIMKLNLMPANNIYFSIGTNLQTSFKEYAGIVSLLVGADNRTIPDIATTIYWNNVIANICVAIIGGFIVAKLTDSKRYEINGK